VNNDNEAYQQALIIANFAHANQKRKDGEPYINHPLRVSEAATLICSRPNDAKIIGILHDVIEDSSITIEQIGEYGFNAFVIAGLMVLTHLKSDSYLDYILKIKNSFNDDFTKIKLCDINDNLVGATGTMKDKYLLAKYILEN
jgi:(p)ppGpp synthase/HD superfamily hydrolase